MVTHKPSDVRLVVGSDGPEHAELVTLGAIQHALDRLRAIGTHVLVDTPPTFTEKTLTVLDAAHLVCLVTSATVPSLTATKECLDVFGLLKVPDEKVLIVLNRTTAQGASLQDVAQFFGRTPEFVIPRSDHFESAANSGIPLFIAHGGDAAAQDFKTLAEKLDEALHAAV